MTLHVLACFWFFGFVCLDVVLFEFPVLQDGFPFVVLLKGVGFIVFELDVWVSLFVGTDVGLRVWFIGCWSEDACVSDCGSSV